MDEAAPRRADARRNRERLVRAAGAAFADRGPMASLDAIARAAGVGSGTLYRHFPNREDLVRAVYRAQVDDACARGRALVDGLAADPAADPVTAVRAWLRLLVSLSARNGPAGALIVGAARWPAAFAEECHTDLTAVGAALLASARPQLQPGVTLGDLHALVTGVATALTGADDPSARAERLLDLILDGVRKRVA